MNGKKRELGEGGLVEEGNKHAKEDSKKERGHKLVTCHKPPLCSEGECEMEEGGEGKDSGSDVWGGGIRETAKEVVVISIGWGEGKGEEDRAGWRIGKGGR